MLLVFLTIVKEWDISWASEMNLLPYFEKNEEACLKREYRKVPNWMSSVFGFRFKCLDGRGDQFTCGIGVSLERAYSEKKYLWNDSSLVLENRIGNTTENLSEAVLQPSLKLRLWKDEREQMD